MVKSHTSFRSYKFTHTTDGVNDYYVGDNGVSGFSITDFQGLSKITINILINVPSTINSASPQKILFELSNNDRSGIWDNQCGAFSGLTTNEYLGINRFSSGSSAQLALRDGGSISAGWHLFSFSSSDVTLSRVAVDGVVVPAEIIVSGINSVTTSFTATKMSLMAATNGAVPYACEWRELSIYANSFTSSEILDLYRYYTKGGGVALGKSTRTAARYAPHRSNLIELYKANIDSGLLKGTKSNSHDMVLTNF